MNRPNDQKTDTTKNMLPMFAGGVMIAIVSLMMTMVWPVWNLFPQYVTETVKVVSVDQSGCWVDTQDNYLVKIVSSCNGQPGQHIMGTYDVKIKQRMHAFLP
ncbi:MAG: hypothetical protein KGI10_06600 [Thaumarchaeota archaeon]|nr:hypothetical protein [Nitrososphaerota archaeon]